jgi:hypothetical protein
MRKSVIDKPNTDVAALGEPSWLQIQELAVVEITSEDPDFPMPYSGLMPGPDGEQRSQERN